MTKVYRFLIGAVTTIMTLIISIGYAAITDTFFITGTADLTPPAYDVYILDITPQTSGGTSINTYFSTVMSAKTVSAGTSSFTVTLQNRSDKVYVFERVIDLFGKAK